MADEKRATLEGRLNLLRTKATRTQDKIAKTEAALKALDTPAPVKVKKA